MKTSAQFFIRNTLKHNFLFSYRLRKIKEIYNRSLSDQLALQNNAFIALVRRAYKYSSFYRAYYNQYGVDIKSIKDTRDIKALPSITKSILKQHADDILIGPKLFAKAAFTSGTSGSPLMVYRNYSSTIEEEAYLWRHREMFGHRIGMKTVSLRAELDRDTFKMFDPFSNTLMLSSYRLSDKTVEAYYNEIASFSPNAIYAFPSSVEILANFLLEKGLSLHVPLIFTSSETVYPFQREKIEKVFNAIIVDWYGNAERSIALQENLEGTYDELSLYSINEYGEDQTITTSLINTSFPIIRYEVNDIFVPDTSTGKVSQIIGRVDDAVELPDGTKVVRLGLVFKGLDEISFAQVIQNNYKELLVNVVPTALFHKESYTKIRKNMESLVGKEIAVKINLVSENEIIKTERGKYKLVINNLNSAQLEDIVTV